MTSISDTPPMIQSVTEPIKEKMAETKPPTFNGLRNCILCDISFQKMCHPYATDDDHSFLCECCLRIETAWTIEDCNLQDED